MLKSYGSRAEAMNAYAQGARSWMAPEVGGGLWMLPYKKVEDPREPALTLSQWPRHRL